MMTSTTLSMATSRATFQSIISKNAFNPLSLRDIFSVWRERHESRLTLRRLDDHMLADIGMCRADAEIEIAKPFWRR